MFNQLKAKLTFIFTLSLLCLLLSFIGVLYFLISHEINDKEVEEIRVYYDKEKGDFIEDLFEKKHHLLEYDPNRSIFYYVYNQKGELVYGKETVQSFFEIIEGNSDSKASIFTKRIDWGQQHFLIIKKPLDTHGFVILGMDITGEKHLIENITWTLFALTLFFSLIYAFLGYYFAGQAMKPIKTAFNQQEKFVSDASHELRTPLSIFYSSVDLLMREEKSNLSRFGQEVLQDVKIEAHLMNKLVNDLLILARSDKNQLILVKKEVNLSLLLTSVCKRFFRKVLNNTQFEQKVQSGIYLVCDETRIQQLLYILLDNALRYTKEGKVTVTLTVKASEKVITIEDTGCGIAKEDLPFIFDRFYRADVTREKGGSGLGLSIANAIVTAHGGEIFVSSTIGKGSVFTVIFK
ncbi:Adaptive-response sensory-kinase SasA [Neobacillus rhizosphaerae]|uniref:histidine kinase n=1 Tax=Neobacillus rhizosphaerae TaxID=2880965 RepID=A0ABN8KLA7_9BACI|nr:HAMP domain-containing sensor histidine kinase [Neobacillus rhizosphaerae]CAH2714202.1 Adaptive-response sensory-kinase SasA [Neobacillus rhizosphaerae]